MLPEFPTQDILDARELEVLGIDIREDFIEYFGIPIASGVHEENTPRRICGARRLHQLDERVVDAGDRWHRAVDGVQRVEIPVDRDGVLRDDRKNLRLLR